MSEKKIILVTGATGAQGGSVARTLLAEGNFSVRILTRNAKSDKALELFNAGADIAEGDLDDIGSLLKAMNNCYGVFGITNYWEHFDKEFQQGKNLVDAVQLSNIRHFVFHTLPDYSQLSNEKYPTPHCDIKAELERYTRSLGIPASFVHTAFYYENFFNFFPLQLAEDGSFYFGFPQGKTKLSMVSVEDTGGIVAAIFNYPNEYTGRVVGLVGADQNCYEYAAEMTKVFSHTVHFRDIPHDQYAALGFPGAEELANMFEVQKLYIPDRFLGLLESYGLHPDMLSFKKWLQINRQKFDTHFRSLLEKEVAVSGIEQ